MDSIFIKESLSLFSTFVFVIKAFPWASAGVFIGFSRGILKGPKTPKWPSPEPPKRSSETKFIDFYSTSVVYFNQQTGASDAFTHLYLGEIIFFSVLTFYSVKLKEKAIFLKNTTNSV